MNLIYFTLVLHGVGALIPWNIIVTAKEYFVDYKLASDSSYKLHFLPFITVAAQVPNLLFNWINVFVKIDANLTSRVVWTLLVEVLVLVLTVVMAMVDTQDAQSLFFYLTLASVVVLNMANGIYQNTVYGIAAKLPFKYTGAVVLGSNLSGTVVSLMKIGTLALSPNDRTAAIYYFIVALFVLLACFDTYFALPLNRFYRYHDHVHSKTLRQRSRFGQKRAVHALPYMRIFKKAFPQCFNVFFTFFVTLSVFPVVLSETRSSSHGYVVPDKYFTAVTCFLTFNLSAVIGNIIPSKRIAFPGKRWLFIPVVLRFLFIPFFLLCNYRPVDEARSWPVLFNWNEAYWAGVAAFGLSGGYLSSLAMMYCPR